MTNETCMKRKAFISTMALLGAAGATNAMNSESKPLLHHVFFWLKNPDSAADKQELIKGLKTLAAIPTIRQIHIGVLASTEKRDVVDTSWDVSELMFFDDAAGQKVYQDHPIHEAFVKNYAHLWKKVIVYDAQNV
jgi:Stress responsive A/B Barrel Domain